MRELARYDCPFCGKAECVSVVRGTVKSKTSVVGWDHQTEVLCWQCTVGMTIREHVDDHAAMETFRAHAEQAR